MAHTGQLTEIPLIEAGRGGALPSMEAAGDRLGGILDNARRRYGPTALRAGDALSRRWLAKAGNPYLAEIEAVAARLGRPGAYMLNLSYEWGCTTGAGPDPGGAGNRMLRTLDWPLDGLGRALVVAHHEGTAGDWFSATWPGFSGVTTAMAPGRFSAAINQPPMRWTTPLMALDWVRNRLGIWQAGGLPPVHLLRKVFDHCTTYAEAKARIESEPVCLPAFFTLSGMEPEESCAVERLESRAAVREGAVSTANHWICLAVPGRARGTDSRGRFARMEAVRNTAGDDFTWVTPPVFNDATRVAAVANARTGTFIVQGWEAEGPVSEIFRLRPDPA